MEDNKEDLLTDIVQQMSSVRRKSLLPWWIKVFMWVFLVLGAFTLIGIIFASFGSNFQISLYGLETNEPFSTIGLCIILLFLFKGVTAYGLLRETDWAINMGLIDAIIGIVICVFIMLVPLPGSPSNGRFSFRLELILLIPYLKKLLNIKSAWQNANQVFLK